MTLLCYVNTEKKKLEKFRSARIQVELFPNPTSLQRTHVCVCVRARACECACICIHIQDVSGGIVNVLEGGSMDYSE